MMRAYYDPDASLALPASRSEMRKLIPLLLIVCSLAAASGCVYRASISQGNLIKQEDLDQVEVGMTRNQVRFLLGTPLIDDPFHQSRWDYVYFIRVGRDPATFKRWVTIQFENDIVVEIDADQELDPNL
jgi:outer membrane protein assembly factor BamE